MYSLDMTTIMHLFVSVWAMVFLRMFINNSILCILLVLFIGIGKEVLDPVFSVTDLTADLIGIYFGYYITKG